MAQAKPTNPAIAAIILGAGTASRYRAAGGLARSKLLATYHGKPMICHSVEAALAAGANPVLVVTGHEAEAVQQALEHVSIKWIPVNRKNMGQNKNIEHGFDAIKTKRALTTWPVRFVHNANFAKGLSSSLACGLAAIPDACVGALILLGDMPTIAPAILTALMAACAETGEAGDREEPLAVVPVYDGTWGNPVLLLRAAFAPCQTLTGDQGARAFLSQHRARVRELALPSAAILMDYDVPKDDLL